MKFKVLGTALLSATLLLTACGQNNDNTKKDDNKKSETKSDKKSNDPKKDKKKETQDKKDKTKEKDNEQSNQTSEQNTNQQQSTEQTNQQSQQNTAEQQSGQSNQEPTKEEIAEWDKQNVKGGTDYGLIDPEEANKASQSQNNEPDEWVKGQEEWANASQSEKEEIRKQDAHKYGYEYDPKNYED